jgi:hypothetical protein
MNLDLRPFFVLWGVLAVAVLVLVGWRKAVSSHEDDSLHVMQGDVVPQQMATANKLDHIDKWGKMLTVITVAFGLVLAVIYMIQGWLQSSTTISTGA